MGFMNVKSKTTFQVQELALKIRQRIQGEQLPDGSFFMTEAQLAQEYKVSRTVTREAVSRLQGLGILEGRKRKGLLIRHPDPLQLFANSLPSLASSPENWLELAQLRYVIEVGAIEIAVRNATTIQISKLEEITGRLEQSILEDPTSSQTVELDLEFHTQILKMTGSRLISGMQQILVQFFQIVPHKETATGSAERIIWEPRELFNAIRDRDVERARAMIRMQFRSPLGLELKEPVSLRIP
jgi:GntR family transcriptional repressor for pyruvate dehydrogenase complex